MADRPILDVVVDSEGAFSEFKRKFDEYQSAVKAMPTQWQKAGTEITAQKTSFEKAVANLEKSGNSAGALAKSMGDAGKIADAAALTWVSMSKHGKLFAGNIFHATQSLMHWTKLTTVFSGILGAGGLFGINRMAASVAGQRTSAAGLGVSYGEQASFLTNFGRLGNAEGILQGFSEAETDVSKKYALRQYLGHAESGDPAKDFAEGLNRFKEFVDKTPQELLGPMLQARGYDKLGIGTEQARIIRGMSAAEVAQLGRGYQGDVAGRLGLPPDVAKKWADFSMQMEKAGLEIETIFGRGVVKLAKPLEHLSESFVHLTENLLKDGSPIAGWIKWLGHGLHNFADVLGSGAAKAKAAELGRDVADVVKLFDAIIAKFPTLAAIAVGSGVGARFSGVAIATGTGLARSGAVGVLGRGAAVALGPAGALAAGGLVASTTPANEGEDERARQKRFHQGSVGPPMPPGRPPMPAGVFPEKVPAKPGSLSDKSAIWLGKARGPLNAGAAQTGAAAPGTPWNREFQPHKGKRGIIPSSAFYNELVKRGAMPVAAAGLTGNVAYESASGTWEKVVLDPPTDAFTKNWGTGDAAVGGPQWEGMRKLGVRPTTESEAQHIIDELKRGGPTTGGLTLNPHSPDDAIICSVDAAIQLT